MAHRRRFPAVDALNDVAVLQLERFRLRRAHDEQAGVGAEVATQAFIKLDELHVAPAATE